MRKNIYIILLFLLASPSLLLAQTKEHPWNIGVHLGRSQWNGDIGDDSYNWNGRFYGFKGISVARYASKAFDVMVNINVGDIGYFSDTLPMGFNNNKFHGEMKGTHQDGTIFFKYKFTNGYILPEKFFIQPYAVLGMGLSWMQGDKIYDEPLLNNPTLKIQSMGTLASKDFIISSGFGLNIRIGKYLNVYGQTAVIYSDHDGRDGYSVANNDGYVMNQIGVTCNFGLFKSPEQVAKAAPTKLICKCDMFDRDSDGIIDKFDLCPDVPGTFQARGCPDRDWDGIPDIQDSCPDVWGIARFHGCPDTDGDGIPDNLDKCPTVRGLQQFNGCPDSDGDGIPDQLDSCPYVKGLSQFNGCPDTDGDGLPDQLDKCPREAGPKTNQGCPEIKESVKKIFEQALTGVQFQTAKSILLPKSFPILDNVAKICKENPSYFLIINGHTDNQGDPDKNLKLSEDRAYAVRVYLIKKGVQSNRLESHGYGQTQAIDTNDSPEGRAKNRRVEFKVRIIN